MKDYECLINEAKWQKYWFDNQLFCAKDFSDKPKFYALIEFPYPSGTGMHVGHIKAYASLEVVSRKRRMEGYNVLFPIGFDAFGLPTENQAIQTGIHPRKLTDRNIKTFTNQLQSLGFSFDYSRVIDTSNENYYKWTQWIFARMFENGLVYRNKTFVNFCPTCQVVLSNEESQGGVCDRCNDQVIQMQKDVWFLKISAYAEKLLVGLNDVDYLPRIKSEQENWIGKSTGALVDFSLTVADKLTVYTTRPDTIFGATFMVIAPEHPLLTKYRDVITNIEEVEKYQESAKKKTEFERVNLNKEKTGVRLIGIEAINPLTKKSIPIFIADYVITTYGTGAIMAVPGHDTRDYEFAKKFDCPIIEVIKGGNIEVEAYTSIEDGVLVNSDFLNDLSVEEAKKAIIKYLEANKLGNQKVQYKMQDWAFNRQRYWGEPIPIIHCPKCGEVLVPDDQLPLRLPDVEEFKPSKNGESPLASVESFVNTTCPKCGAKAKRETDTMPQWAGSSWYYLRYCDVNNSNQFADLAKLKYWMPVDWYNGGMEHVTRHMIYSRFWNLFLADLGLVSCKEPYAKRTAQGLILASDGEKMSKSKGNSVNVSDVLEIYGADTVRMYTLFIGDYELPSPWSDNGVKGIKRFLDRVWRQFEKVDLSNQEYSNSLESLIHKTIKEVGQEIESAKFNTAISKLMILSNEYADLEIISKKDYEVLLKMLYPFAPHICEELNQMLNNTTSLVFADWPAYDEGKMSDIMDLVVQVNGKVRGVLKVKKDEDDEVVKKLAFELPNVIANIDNRQVKKIVIVKNRICNIVVI